MARPLVLAAGLVACGPRAPAMRVALEIEAPAYDVATSEAEIAVPIEHAVMTVPRIEHVATRVVAGRVAIELALAANADALAVATDVRARLQATAHTLPSDVAVPTVRVEPVASVAIRYVLASATHAPAELTALDAALVRALEPVPGVLGVERCGTTRTRWRVELDPARLAATDLALGDVVAALRAAPASSLDALASTPIRDGVRARDVASVREQAEPPACRATSEVGPVIAGVIHVRPDADADAIRAALAAARATLPAGMTLDERAGDGLAIALAEPTLAARVGRAAGEVPGIRHVLIARDRLVVDPPAAEPAVIAAVRGLLGVVVHPRDELAIRISGPDRDRLRTLARAIGDAVRARPELATTGTLGLDDHPEVQLVLDREMMARLGLSTAELADATRAVVGGLDLDAHTTLAVGGDAVQIGVRGAGGRVPLAAVIERREHLIPAELRRDDGQRWVAVTATGDADALRAVAATVKLPPGYHVDVAAAGR